MSSSPVKDAAEGAAKGGLDFIAEKIPEWVAKFNSGEFGFLQDRETIRTVKNEQGSADWTSVNQFISDPVQRIQVNVGLALRRLTGQKLGEARQRLLNVYGKAGLHVAELAESGILNELLTRLIAITNGIAPDVSKAFDSFLRNSERLVVWITSDSVAVRVARETDIRLQSLPPHLAILLAKGLARTNLDRVIRILGKMGYVIERDEVEKQHTVYIYTKEARGSVMHWADLFTEEGRKKK